MNRRPSHRPLLQRRSPRRASLRESSLPGFSPRGFSLLEAILALAILGVSLAVLSQIMGTGVDAALEAEQLLHCRMAAESKMAEVLVDLDLGVTPVTTIDLPAETFGSDAAGMELSTDVEVLPAQMMGLLTIRVTGRAPRAAFTLTRLVVDPIYLENLAEQTSL